MSKKPSFLETLKLSHTKEAIVSRLQKAPKKSYLKDFIYGAIDGTVTTFAVVAGVAGAALSPSVVLILGMANLIADGFSMAVSNYLGTKAEKELLQKAREEEEYHVSIIPEGEKEEIRQIFSKKGFQGEELEKIVSVITSDVRLWVDTMLREELGMSLEMPSEKKAALTTFCAFVVVGFLPLFAFFAQMIFPDLIHRPFYWSTVMTAIGFFIVGAFKSPFVKKNWILTGLETFFIGSLAALLAYFVGYGLSFLTT